MIKLGGMTYGADPKTGRNARQVLMEAVRDEMEDACQRVLERAGTGLAYEDEPGKAAMRNAWRVVPLVDVTLERAPEEDL